MKEKEPVQSIGVENRQHAEMDRWLEVFSIFIHDIESPLATVKYLLKNIESGKLDMQNPRHRNLVRSSNIAVTRAESIFYDIMAVARTGRAEIPVTTQELVPTAVIEEAIALAEGSAEENQIEITFTDNSSQIAVLADPRLLKRVIDNLIYNGLRHTPQSGTISVYTEPKDDSVFIHVKDSGSGLGNIDREVLFEKYGQIQLRAQGKHRGVGLGLYFCKLAATGMGGTVFASDHPEGGAVFSLKLIKA